MGDTKRSCAVIGHQYKLEDPVSFADALLVERYLLRIIVWSNDWGALPACLSFTFN